MLLAELTAIDGKANHITQLLLLLWGFQIILHGIVAQFRGTDTITADEFDGEALTGKGLVPPLVVEKLGHIDVNTVTAGGQNHALHAGLVEALCKILALFNPGF